MTSNEVLARVADVATVDLLAFLDIEDDGSFKVNLFRARKAGLGHPLKRVRQTKDMVDIEVEARLPALVKLGEYYNLWNRESPPEIGTKGAIHISLLSTFP